MTALFSFLLLAFASCNDKSKVESETKTDSDVKDTSATTASTTAPPMDSAAMMKAFQDYATPGDMHKLMASFTGTWDGDVTMWMADGAPPSKSKSTATNKMIYNGLYQESKHKGDFGGMPFEGTSIWGYDNAKKKFFSTWIDNMGSGIMLVEGDYDPASKTFTFAGSYTNPINGKDCNIRETFQIIDDNTQVMKMYGPDLVTNKEYQTMEIKMTRRR